MIKGFKDFLMRGNVVDLAVAIVIGTAFAAVVKAFVDGIIGGILGAHRRLAQLRQCRLQDQRAA